MHVTPRLYFGQWDSYLVRHNFCFPGNSYLDNDNFLYNLQVE